MTTKQSNYDEAIVQLGKIASQFVCGMISEKDYNQQLLVILIDLKNNNLVGELS